MPLTIGNFNVACTVMAGLFCLGTMNVTASAQEMNALALSNGAVLKSYTSEYGGRGSSEWIALALIDGNPAVGWSSEQFKSAPNEFLFELEMDFSLQSFSFDNTRTDEPTHPGISAKSIEVHVSADSETGPYQKLVSGEIAAGKVSEVALPEPVTARWVKLVIAGNGGHQEYTELMEFSAFGTPLEERAPSQNFSGVYDTNWGRFFLKHRDGELDGCYDHDSGTFSGKQVDGLMNIEWRETGDQSGSAALAITDDGTSFSGLWYENAQLQGTWAGVLSTDQLSKPACAVSLVEEKKTQVAAALDTYGVAKLYGIYFDFDSDAIKPASAKTLADVKAWLASNPGKTVVFEGHTDAKGSDDYNQTLSAKRAAAVVFWLSANGIDMNRLSHTGYGEALPVADNSTENGRSLNRRVEMKILN